MLLVATHAPELNVEDAKTKYKRFSANKNKQEQKKKQDVLKTHLYSSL